MKYYISDLHFDHENIIRLDDRKFDNVNEMNRYIINQWNKKVTKNDNVIVLGDMFWSKDPERNNKILSQLAGQISLVEGNHDHRWLSSEGVNLNRFNWIKPYAKISDGERTVIASHHPVMCYDRQYRTDEKGEPLTYMLYGHVHNTHDELLVHITQEITRRVELNGTELNRRIPCNMINCFCCYSDYTPLSLDEWIELDRKRRSKISIPSSLDIPDKLEIDDEM